ncbi:MAG TPA: alanine racemase [Ornithinimicrobium sp.]|uniref:alanine racemase n=1 Tax=Ornithinimicrobium sp. TaxID=1977084 RepID=UPI002B478A08|nr:alanine racemase [Ornithinimicrobium sp.]HKJ13132.1 alanine racemase [Ornithinimicrobium sp.]
MREAAFDPEVHPAWATVDLDAIEHNVRQLRRRAGSAALMAVVKADAYGHGLVPSARAALRGGADWLGVAQMSEALALRAAGVDAPLLTWLHTRGVDYARAIAADVEIGLSAPWAVQQVCEAVASVGRPARVHLKADTGLGRNGAYTASRDWADLVHAAASARSEGLLEVTGLFTHFAHADAPGHPTVRGQEEAFATAVELAEAEGLRPELRHMSNSAATLTNPGAAWDMVRPGLSVFGLSPVPDIGAPADFGLVPAMTVTARIATVKRVPAGQGVSYGHTFTTERETTLVDVPVGYADGVPRHGSNVVQVSMAGHRRSIAGRVCMDQIVIDAQDLDVAAGDEVILLGTGEHGEPTAAEWADAVGTIDYEIVTRFGPALPRVYVGAQAG